MRLPLSVKVRRAHEALFYIQQTRAIYRERRAPGPTHDPRTLTLDDEMAALNWFESSPARTLCLAQRSSFLKSDLVNAALFPSVWDSSWKKEHVESLVEDLKAAGVEPGPDGRYHVMGNGDTVEWLKMGGNQRRKRALKALAATRRVP